MRPTIQEQAEKARRCLSRYFAPGAIAKGWPMGVQITRMLDAGMRKELRGRIRGLLTSMGAAGKAERDGADNADDLKKQLGEELKSFYFALTGSYPTHDEMMEMVREPERKE